MAIVYTMFVPHRVGVINTYDFMEMYVFLSLTQSLSNRMKDKHLYIPVRLQLMVSLTEKTTIF